MSLAEAPASAVLPGRPPHVLQAAYGALEPALRAALLPHLLGGTGADRVSGWLREAGHPVGATSIKNYRRSLA